MKKIWIYLLLCLVLSTQRVYAQTVDPYSVLDDWALRNARIYEAWQISEGDPGVTVVLGDTQVYARHPDLEDRVISGNPEDDEATEVLTTAHGTFTAGIIAAAHGNGIGVAGVCPNCTIWSGSDSDSTVSGAFVMPLIGVAIDHHFSIINYDFAAGLALQSELESIQQGEEKGVLVIAAAGNAGTTDWYYPAANSCVLGVGSINRNDQLVTSSNHGFHLDMVAPGLTIASTDLPGERGYSGEDYARASGTSFAAPHVSGTAALIRSIRPDLSAQDIFDILLKSARDLGEPGFDPIFGYGALDARAALELAQRWQASSLIRHCSIKYERIAGMVTHAGLPAESVVELYDSTGLIMTTTTSAINGIFHFDIEYNTLTAPYIIQVGKERQSAYFQYDFSGGHNFELPDIAVEAPISESPMAIAPHNLRALVRDYGKIILLWDGNGGEVLDHGQLLSETTLQTNSYTLWGRGTHELEVRNQAGAASLRVDNSLYYYLPIIQN